MAKTQSVPVAALALVLIGGWAAADEPPAALTIRFVHPDRQCARAIALFEGARAPHPAAALAGWKRASGSELSKQTEALITVVNPAMVPELKLLDSAEILINYEDVGAGPPRWLAVAPRDDGTFAAVATAMVLTDGATEPPIDGVRVDRLGPPGSPVMARSARVVAVASDREELRAALAMDPARVGAVASPVAIDSGILCRLDPEGLGTDGSIDRRRLAEGLRALGCRDAEGAIRLEGETLEVDLVTRLHSERTVPVLDPAWLDWVPATGPALALAVALDPSPAAWDQLFAVADRIDRADPARAGLVPLRTRLNLIALAARVRPEADLWPQLRGLSACAYVDEEGTITGVAVALHAVDAAAAERIETRIFPRLSAAGRKEVAALAGKPLQSARREASVLIGWGGPAFADCLDARDHPEHSAGPMLRNGLGPGPYHRAGAFWLGQFSPALAESGTSPILWSGRTDGTTAHDVLRWPGLRGVVRRFLDRLPYDPPPDQGSSAR